jgi:hypothetical protein
MASSDGVGRVKTGSVVPGAKSPRGCRHSFMDNTGPGTEFVAKQIKVAVEDTFSNSVQHVR